MSSGNALLDLDFSEEIKAEKQAKKLGKKPPPVEKGRIDKKVTGRLLKPLRALLVSAVKESNEDAFNYIVERNYEFKFVEGEVFAFIDEFVRRNNTVPTLEYTLDHFKSASRTEIIDYLEDLSTYPEVSYPDFKDLIDRSLDQQLDLHFKKLLDDVRTIQDFGLKVDKQELKGRGDAISHFITQSLAYDPGFQEDQVGTLQEDILDLWDEYQQKKLNPLLGFGITSGYRNLDKHVKGGLPGELHLVLGFTGSGKSTFALNYAYNVAYILNRDVLFFTLEMNKHQVQRNLLAIHSANEKFARFHDPIPVSDLTSGTLTPDQEKFMEQVVIPDLSDNDEYGSLIIDYPGSDFTISTLRSRLAKYGKKYDLAMLVVDHAGLVHLDKGQSQRNAGADANLVIQYLRQTALTYRNWDGSMGLFTLVPFQANREGYERATKSGGHYDLRALSLANEAERAADSIYYVYQPEDKKVIELTFGHLKFRRGPLFAPFKLLANWDSCYFGNMAEKKDFDIDSFKWDS